MIQQRMGFGLKNPQTCGFNGEKKTFIFTVFSLRFRWKFRVMKIRKNINLDSKNKAALKARVKILKICRSMEFKFTRSVSFGKWICAVHVEYSSAYQFCFFRRSITEQTPRLPSLARSAARTDRPASEPHKRACTWHWAPTSTRMERAFPWPSKVHPQNFEFLLLYWVILVNTQVIQSTNQSTAHYWLFIDSTNQAIKREFTSDVFPSKICWS